MFNFIKRLFCKGHEESCVCPECAPEEKKKKAVKKKAKKKR